MIDGDHPERPRRLCIIFNPAAGWRARRRLRAVLRRLAELGCDIALRDTRGPGDAERLAREAAADAGGQGGIDVVVAAGGDGTVNEVVAGLAGSDLPLGIIPLGTANVLAAEIGLDAAPAATARVLAQGSARPIYLGVANDRRFTVMAGVGLDARVVRGVNLTLKRWAGKFAYVWCSLVELIRDRSAPYRVVIGGQTFEAAAVIVANGHFYGGRFVCAPDARIDEVDLHVVLFERPGRWNALRYIWGMVTGGLSRLADVRVVRTTKLSIDGPTGEPVQGDGDIIATLPVEIAVAPERVRLVRPTP